MACWTSWPALERRVQGGWSDAIAIKDQNNATAYRCEPAGREVWGAKVVSHW
jgi:hypothetical protein